MKTLLLAPELFTADGGIPRILRLYLKALCDLAGETDSVSFLALNDAVADSSDLRRYAGPRLTEWETCNRHKGRFTRSALRGAPKNDLIVCGHIAQLPVAWAARRLNRRLRYTLVAHGIEVWRPLNVFERLAVRGAKQIWCVSDFTRQQLLRACPLPEGRAVVLPNALDPYFQIHPDAPASANTLLVVSRLSQADNYKGVDHLIEAMPTIKQSVPDATLRIVGRGDDLPRLQKIAADQKLNGSVIFLGYLSDADMKRELSACRAFALPSQKEGFGLVYLEAMAYGKPCIGAREGGTPEVISPESGLLAKYGDPADLASVCITGLQRTWDSAAIRAQAERFSYPNFRDRLHALLAR